MERLFLNMERDCFKKVKYLNEESQALLILWLLWVTETEFLLTISIQYQAAKWWEWRKTSINYEITGWFRPNVGWNGNQGNISRSRQRSLNHLVQRQHHRQYDVKPLFRTQYLMITWRTFGFFNRTRYSIFLRSRRKV